jgi:hypothetical protein
LTSGKRSVEIAIDAEFQGALGVVLNSPTPNNLIKSVKRKLEIPVIVTVVSEDEDFVGRIDAGVDIFNVSGGLKTRNDETILEIIEAGANAVSYTPPSTSELFKPVMENYRRLSR